MPDRPYLRAYIAGVLLPVFLLPLIMCALAIAYLVRGVPEAVARAVIFPMAAVPHLWGFWNLLYVRLELRRRLPLGAFGALLPLLLTPIGLTLARLFEVPHVTPERALLGAPVAIVGYYLAWKYVVSFFNRLLAVP